LEHVSILGGGRHGTVAGVPTRWVGRVLLVPAWLLLVALGALVLARALAFDERRLTVLADAYTLWIFLPAYLVLAAALCFRSRALAALAAVVVVAHLAWVVPPLFRTADVPAGAATAPRVRLVAANVRFDNRQFDAMLDELVGLDADVLVLSEVTPEWWQQIVDHGLVRTHPHVVREPAWGAAGMAILSNRELHDPEVIRLHDRSVPSATIRIGGRSLRVLGVHTIAPNFAFGKNREQQHAVSEIIGDAPRPRVVAGDFNATPYNRWYDELLGLGLTEVHEALGQPFATTWPNGRMPLPPVRIDHVFVDDAVAPLSVHQGVGTGSDHRPVITDLAVVPQRD
jgi:endonuclease/exonuclease/phosphatase (EEP) superfamily protein YafD